MLYKMLGMTHTRRELIWQGVPDTCARIQKVNETISSSSRSLFQKFYDISCWNSVKLRFTKEHQHLYLPDVDLLFANYRSVIFSEKRDSIRSGKNAVVHTDVVYFISL